MRIRDKPAWATIAFMLVMVINGMTLCTAVSDGSMNNTLNRSDETLMRVYDGATINDVPDDYMKIQWAVDTASAGDTVIVRDGTYTGNVDVNKPYANISGGADAQIYYSFQDLNGGLITNEEKAYSHLYEIMDKYKEFYVYFDKSASINHYIPSGWMGDVDDITLDDNWTSNPHTGESCIKITYSASGSNGKNWAGIYWQYPDGNWGNYPGYNLAGATNFSFWARGENGNEKGEFKIGGINRPPDHDPNLPYQDSFGPVTTGVVTLTNTWKKYTINLTGRNLGNVIGGFCWVTNKPTNPSGCTIYLDDIMYENRNQLRFLESYESTPTFDSDYTAWTYDNTLALLAFIARGNATDKERAQILADSFLYVQNNDQTFNDGRVRDGYWATDIKDPSGKFSSIKSPGSGTGNMAWTIIALLHYYEVTNDTTYLNASILLGNWIHDNCNDIRGAGGYTGGYEDKNFDWELEKITWKSTEHNIDAYVAFTKLYNVTGNTTWLDRAIHANKFVKAMWNETEGHFWTGTKEDGVTLNEDILPADVNTWGLMALDNPNKYGGGIQWVEDNCLVDPCPRGCGFKGFDFNDDKDGVWFEGTAHTCIAYQIMNESIRSNDFITEIRRAKTYANNSNGKGIVAACHDNVTTGFDWGYPNALHIGATSWYIFAEQKLNPFWGINTSDPIPCPPPIIWYVDDDGGAGIDFTSIQDAVDVSTDGDTIIVNSGTYYENVNVSYQLKLLGNDTGSSKPVVDAGGSGSAITLSADGITLDGFNATNSGINWGNSGILIDDSSSNIIIGNNISNNYFGISLNNSKSNIIMNNNVNSNKDGLHIAYNSSNNSVISNIIISNSDHGIAIGDGHRHNNCNIITDNNISNNEKGIYLLFSSNNKLRNNTLISNKYNFGVFGGGDFYQDIDTSNTVNGKPIYYLVEKEGITLDESSNAGYVGLVSCDNVTVKNLNITNNINGIILASTTNSFLQNNSALNNLYGIRLYYSSNNILSNNKASNNGEGIYLDGSCNNTLSNNIANSNNWGGIQLSFSSNNTLSNNMMFEDSICIWGSSLKCYTTHEIDATNTVNGKPVYYWKNKVGGKVPEGAGEIILANCKNVLVENQNSNNGTIGIEIAYSSNITLTNNTANSNNRYGISLHYSSNNTLSNNTVSDNRHGIYLRPSNNNILSNNTITNNIYGILLSDSSNNTHSSNTVSNNLYGISLYRYSDNNIVTNTNISNNYYGIHLYTITGNNARNNKIYLNNFINNGDNVYSEGPNNIWNSTEKITYTYNGITYTNYLGNYWSDYIFEGNDTNGDGIGDTPYSIYGDNDRYPLMMSWEKYFVPPENSFDTGPSEKPYPSISGTHNGTITLNQTITVQKLYTYPCAGTGGHTEYARIWNDTWSGKAAYWGGYQDDWHNISFNDPITLFAAKEYYYEIRTGSYPQIHHTNILSTPTGFITCTQFVDVNMNSSDICIPAIKLVAAKTY